ncbi:hypothetical protein B296_00011141 [Ensete ventricosum]|uniref:Uncharacterized protein n=1 Tax=Ensete ventricosum TaxID=4639 RepID=A0A427AFX2_ENSVE|nr:hypothetical protein B296_00011141 [Ensete ventricosum]
MASTLSFSVSSFSSSHSSHVPPPREEIHRSNDSSESLSVLESSSSSVMTRAEAKVFKPWRFCRYGEHEPDAWESPCRGDCPGTAPPIPAPAPPPPLIPPAEFGSASDVQEIPIEEAEGVPEASRKRRGGDSTGQKRKDRRKSPHKADRASRGKGSTDASVEPPAPRQRPKSVRELCSAQAGVDGRNYHAIRMCNLSEQAYDAPLDPNLRPLTHGTPVWQSGEASVTYIRGMLLPRLASDLYTLPSEVLMDGAAKAMVLMSLLRQELHDLKEGRNPDAVAAAEARAAEAQSIVERLQLELNEANNRRASAKAELEQSRSESASQERQLVDLRERLGDSEDQLRGTRAQVRQMEIELLDLARSKEALREDLPKRAIEEYNESPGFEMGLVRMGRVSLEYGYQLALTRLQARHPGVEIELDPFVTLPEDADVVMADEQPFDDSLSPPKE